MLTPPPDSPLGLAKYVGIIINITHRRDNIGPNTERNKTKARDEDTTRKVGRKAVTDQSTTVAEKFPNQLTSRPWTTPPVTRRPGAFHQSQSFPEKKSTNRARGVDTKYLSLYSIASTQNKMTGTAHQVVKKEGRCFPGEKALLGVLQLRLLYSSRTHPLILRIRTQSWTGSPVSR